VLVTSRARLVGLEGARLLDLEVLQAGQAVDLLARIVGGERVAAERQAAATIVGYCGYLPLAVRIGGRDWLPGQGCRWGTWPARWPTSVVGSTTWPLATWRSEPAST
jgi:hypothetical protein